MAEVKWIRITTTMFEDEKIDFIESLPDADSILIIWIKLLTLAGKCNAAGYIMLTENIPYEIEMLAHKFKRPLNTVKLALDTFKRLGMVEDTGQGLYISNWEKHQNVEGLEKIREQTRKRVAKHREKKALQDGNATGNVTVTPSNATDIDIDKDKEYINTIGDFFESIWSLYPKKKGKGKVSETQKAKLYKIGYEEMARCIERYKKANTEVDYQYIQYGSTFFNSGYVDYLDVNYTEEAPKPKNKVILK